MSAELANLRIKKIKNDWEPKLLALPGVVGVGISETIDKGGRRQPCIRIYVEKRDDETLQHLPEEIEGFLTDIKEVVAPH